MAINTPKSELVAFDEMVEGFDDMLVVAQEVERFNMPGSAQEQARKHVEDAESRARQLEEDSTNRANRTVQEAEQRAATITAQFEQRKAALERRVEELRVYEREYRTRLRGYLESQLRDLDASGRSDDQGEG